MDKGKLVIGVPYIEDCGELVRLSAKVKRPDKEMVIYYEIDKKYSAYLCEERGDAFFVALFRYAMLHNLDIESECALTDVLYYNITTYHIPTVSRNIPKFCHIQVTAPTKPPVEQLAHGVATGFSGGVDSFFTVLKHLNHNIEYARLTHLFFTNTGALTANYETSKRLYKEKIEQFSLIADEMGLELIGVNTNLTLFYDNLPENRLIMQPEACRTCSCVFALQKLVHLYYFASAGGFETFEFTKAGAGYHDLLTLQMLSNGNVIFYSSGAEKASRMEKLEDICHEDIVKRHLTVCAGKNCGRCNKCLRTQAELYALGVLDEYEKVFDVQNFKQNLASRFAAIFSMKAESQKGFTRDTLQKARLNHVNIPIRSRIMGYFILRPMRNIHALLRRKVWYEKLYYKYNIDIKMQGENAKIWRK